MSGKITGFFREFALIFSIILTILGIFVLFIGITTVWFQDIPRQYLNFNDFLISCNVYFLILGFIVFAFGFYYLYTYIKNKRFIEKELETNKRSELQKQHLKLKITVKKMPKKYKKMLKEKEKELHLK